MDKQLEKLMRKSFREFSQDNIYCIAMKQSHAFWQAHDYYRHSSKAKIFRLIYMKDKDITSLLAKSRECYVDERTLFRYRNDFVNMYKYFVENLNKNGVGVQDTIRLLF